MLSLSPTPLIDAQKIAKRIGELGKQIGEEYDFDIIVGVMTGAFIFVADLCRAMPKKNAQIKFIKASSYGDSTESSHKVKVSGLDTAKIEGARLLLVDDILDTGHTMQALVKELSAMGAKEIRTCVFLDKPERREVPITADYVGFEIPNAFVVGYGLDFADEYRTFPDVWTLEEKQ
jgi:hypoxanthine phosphoribosyltransferase